MAPARLRLDEDDDGTATSIIFDVATLSDPEPPASFDGCFAETGPPTTVALVDVNGRHAWIGATLTDVDPSYDDDEPGPAVCRCASTDRRRCRRRTPAAGRTSSA